MRPLMIALLVGGVSAGGAGLVAFSPWAQDDEGEGRRKRPERMMRMPPGPSTMVAHGEHIFIYARGTLYKVDPKEMKIVTKLQIEEMPQGKQFRRGKEKPREDDD